MALVSEWTLRPLEVGLLTFASSTEPPESGLGQIFGMARLGTSMRKTKVQSDYPEICKGSPRGRIVHSHVDECITGADSFRASLRAATKPRTLPSPGSLISIRTLTLLIPMLSYPGDPRSTDPIDHSTRTVFPLQRCTPSEPPRDPNLTRGMRCDWGTIYLRTRRLESLDPLAPRSRGRKGGVVRLQPLRWQREGERAKDMIQGNESVLIMSTRMGPSLQSSYKLWIDRA